jgi:hypothetical protein
LEQRGEDETIQAHSLVEPMEEVKRTEEHWWKRDE